MKVKEIISVIESFAPLSLQESWDNSGLCVGSPEDEVTSVLMGLDCTPQLVDEAVACGADMIITHHPLIFSGLKNGLLRSLCATAGLSLLCHAPRIIMILPILSMRAAISSHADVTSLRYAGNCVVTSGRLIIMLLRSGSSSENYSSSRNDTEIDTLLLVWWKTTS